MRKKKKKGAFGWFQTMSPGNPEYNAKMFNHLMGQGDMPTEADMNANVMGGEAVGESLTEAQKMNEYQITWLDYKDRKYFDHIKAYSEKQAAYMFRKNKGRGVVAKILSIDCIDDHSKDDGEQIGLFGKN